MRYWCASCAPAIPATTRTQPDSAPLDQAKSA
jgi:hypothetical protein